MATAEIKSKATLDNSQFNRGLTQMKQGVTGFASGQIRQLGSMIGGAFAVGTVVRFAKNTMEAAHTLQEFASNVNVPVERLQALRLTADRGGASMELMDKTLSRLYKAQAEGAAGNKKINESFEALGMSLKDVQNMTPDQLFERIAVATRGTGEASVQSAAAGNLLGRNYTLLNNTMNDVATGGLQAITDKLRENNEIMSTETVNSAAAMQAAYEKTANQVKVIFQNMFVGAINNVKKTAAVLGAMSAGASWAEANAIADKQIKDEVTSKKSGKARPQAGAIKEAKETKGTFKVEAADSLAKIGGIMGGQTDPLKNSIERLVKEQLRTNELLTDIKGSSSDTASGVNTLNEGGE